MHPDFLPRFHNLLKFVLFTRIFVYAMMGYVMHQYQNAFRLKVVVAPTTEAEQEQFTEAVHDLVCTSVYPKGLMLVQCLIETTFLVAMIFVSKQIRNYVRTYQQSELQQK